MEYHDAKRPALSVFVLAIIFVLALVGGISDGEGWKVATGCIVLGSGLWSSWHVGRWAWWRYGPRHSIDAIR